MVTFNAYSSQKRPCAVASLVLQRGFLLMNLVKAIPFKKSWVRISTQRHFLISKVPPKSHQREAYQMHLRCGTLIFHPAWV